MAKKQDDSASSSIAKAIDEVTAKADKRCCECTGMLQDRFGNRCKHCKGSGVEPKSCDRVDVKK